MTVNITCKSCKKSFETDREMVNLFGFEMDCEKCVDWAHLEFMQRNGKKLGLSCAKGCRCGFGK